MTSPFWPGDERAGDAFTAQALLAAMVAVESAWTGVDLVVPDVELDGEDGGNPVVPLVDALRATHPGVAGLHDGLTSQDVLDTAVVLLLRDAVQSVRSHLVAAVTAVDRLVEVHGGTAMTGRTLTQWALPITFGHKAGAWRAALRSADAGLAGLRFPVQCGGPVGTGGRPADLAARLGLDDSPPWHTVRFPVTRAGDALVEVTDACGRVARDVLELSRPEVGELSEAVGGRSSSMPHKANPVLSVLVRRAALTTPQLAATLHLAAAEQVDERADGAWHAEWDTLRLLARRCVVAASQTAELLTGLRVHTERMAEHLDAAERTR